jgi:hypothetical protein
MLGFQRNEAVEGGIGQRAALFEGFLQHEAVSITRGELTRHRVGNGPDLKSFETGMKRNLLESWKSSVECFNIAQTNPLSLTYGWRTLLSE